MYRITRLGPSEYLLFVEGTDAALRADTTPEALSRWAFDNGADQVRHDYDCKKAEEDKWR